MKKKKIKGSKDIPKRILYMFMGVGSIFIAQMLWWVYFFATSLDGVVENRYIRMIITEGVFFVILIIAGLTIVYRAIRQEIILRQQFRDFFASFSHELKTPIASLRLQTETIQSLDLPKEKQEELLDNILKDTERLELTIQNILDVFKSESDKLEIDPVPTEIDPWLADNIDLLGRAFILNENQVKIDLRSSATVNLDDRYFNAVIANLVQNGVRYSEGKADIVVKSSVAYDKLLLEFIDNGIGIDQKEIENVFDRYYRLDEGSKMQSKGTGLGLFLTRKIVLAHGGSIKAISEGKGKGTCFQIELPLHREK